MTVNDFLTDFQDVLQRESPLSPELLLADLEEWDSMAIMGTMAYLDSRLGIKTTFRTYRDLKSVADVIALAKGKLA